MRERPAPGSGSGHARRGDDHGPLDDADNVRRSPTVGLVYVGFGQPLAMLGPDTGEGVATWPLRHARSNFPMALDEGHHRLLVGCRGPAELVVFDTETGQEAARLDCCGDTDDLFYDARAMLIYVTGGEGCGSVTQQESPDRYRALGKTQMGHSDPRLTETTNMDEQILPVAERMSRLPAIPLANPDPGPRPPGVVGPSEILRHVRKSVTAKSPTGGPLKRATLMHQEGIISGHLKFIGVKNDPSAPALPVFAANTRDEQKTPVFVENAAKRQGPAPSGTRP